MCRYLVEFLNNEGAEAPSFYKKVMDFKGRVKQLLDESLSEKPHLFLVDFSISDSQKITVVLDGDEGVVLQDCIDVSRAIEHNLDRESVDFSLEVASAGLGSPLILTRQYKKNIGRTLKVKTESGQYEGQLIEADEDKIVLSWVAREPKKIGKGKETVQKQVTLPYLEIKEAVVTITF